MATLKRFIPRTLFGRSLLIIVTPLILLQLVAAYVFYERHWDTVSRHMASGLAGEIAAIVARLALIHKASHSAIVSPSISGQVRS